MACNLHAVHPHRHILQPIQRGAHGLAHQLLRIAAVDKGLAALFCCQGVKLECTVQLSLELRDVAQVVQRERVGRIVEAL